MPFGFKNATKNIAPPSKDSFCHVHATLHLPKKSTLLHTTASIKYGSKKTKAIGHIAECKLINKIEINGNNKKIHLDCFVE